MSQTGGYVYRVLDKFFFKLSLILKKFVTRILKKSKPDDEEIDNDKGAGQGGRYIS